jgi:Rap1a immunity proteins
MATRLVKLAFREGFVMRVRALVLMIVAAMIAGPVRAEFIITGSDLYTRCNSNAAEDKFWCLGFVTGVHDALPTGPKGLVCAGPNVTAGQLHDVVVKNLQEHPAMRNLPAALLVGTALGVAFPCKR